MLKYKTFDSWGHQQKVERYVLDNNINYYALFHDCGTGKTKTQVEIYRDKCNAHKRYLKTLIICPLVVVENWRDEILLHSYITEDKIQLLDGCTRPNGKKVKTAQKKIRLEQLESDADVFILNTDNASNVDVWNGILKLGIEFLVIDESHRFKSYNGKRSKAVHRLAGQAQCRYRFILTGSPILQSALDIWSQFYILSPNILGHNYFSFRSKYFYDANASMPAHIHFANWVPKDEKYFRRMGYKPDETMDALNEIIYRHADRVMKDDVLDLPERVYQIIPVTMDKNHYRIYKEMRDHLVAFLKEPTEELTLDNVDLEALPELMRADLAIVKTLRLMQLICGIFTNSDGEVTVIPTNRIKELKRLIEELTSNPANKLIIWTVFTPTYTQIKEIFETLGIKYVMLTGLESKEEKRAAEQAFNFDPEVKGIISNPAAGGTGVNLTAGNYEIDYSRLFKLGDWLQKDSRAYRGGQKRKTTSITLKTPDTMDEKVIDSLNEKMAHAEDILAVKAREYKRNEILEMI